MQIKGFSSEWLEELKQRNDIYDVVSKYVAMNRKGARYWGRCPFHHEKTPSFTVYPERGSFHCYGCHESGDVISFIMKIENIDFYDSISYLANNVGMQVPELRDVDAKNSREDKEKLMALLRDAARYYHSILLKTPKSMEYLKKRGIKQDTIVKFGLGQSPNFSEIIATLRSKGFTDKQMLDSGVASEKNGDLYDSLGGRLIIPIFNSFGNVIAFGGRVMEKTDFAKYKNTRETAIFIKNKTLYGLNFVNKVRQQQKITDLIIVEGYMDTIALVQAGVQNVVASMGTSLTEQQAKIMKSQVDNVYICYDGDAAGQASTLRGLDILKAKGLNVRVISMPEGLDPDEVIIKSGVEGFLKLKEEALPLIEYKLVKLKAEFDFSNPDGRSSYAKRALAVLADLDEVEKSAYVDYIAKLSGIDKADLTKAVDTKAKEPAKEEKSDNRNSAYLNACRFILLSKLSSKAYAKNEFQRDMLTDSTHIKIYDYLVNCERENIPPHPSMIYELEGDERECAEIINCCPNIGKEQESKYYEDCIKTMRKEYYITLIAELTEEMNATKDCEKQLEILKEISELNQLIRR
ncbi:MAG: DNA primase [Clostridia bacterium]|nr:DNA primase [Clostridia bacterium]